MLLRRPGMLIAMLLCVATGLAWILTAAPSQRIPAGRLQINQPFAVDVAFERARLDLPFDHDSRYLLIVGSLSEDRQPRQITLTAEPIEQTEALVGRKLRPLDGCRDEPTKTAPIAESRLAGTSQGDGKPARDRSNRRRNSAAPKERMAVTAARDFYLHVTDGPLDDPRHYARVSGRPVGEGRLVRVYLDSRQRPDELAAGLVEETIRLLDDELFPALKRDVGRCRDVDGDGKFTVLLSPWLGRLQGGKTSLGGFVRGSDFRDDLDPPFSNRCDMMYLNTNLVPGRHLRTLLAHELMHAVCFSARLPSPGRPNGLPEEEDWLNEAIAHLSENLNDGGWSNLDYRVSRFLDHPQQYPLVVDDYYEAGLWRNHGCRGATYLFLRWCVDQYGTPLLQKLIHSPGRGRENLWQATGLEFEELFRRWTVALYFSGLQSPQAGAPAAAETASWGTDLYRSLDLRGPLSNWGLAGPRTIDWDVNAGPCTINLSGTAAAYVTMTSPRAAGARRIRMTGPFGSKLQITFLKLSADCPEIDARAEWIEESATPHSPGARFDDRRLLRVQIDRRARPDTDRKSLAWSFGRSAGAPAAADESGPLVVELVACEKKRGDATESFCFSGNRLENCRETNGSANAPGRPARYVLPLPSADASAEDWRVKVVARNAQGRRVSAWIDRPASGGAADLLRIAEANSPGGTKTDER